MQTGETNKEMKASIFPKGSHLTIFYLNKSFVKTIFNMFYQSFLDPFDGKNRSATAPFVCNFSYATCSLHVTEIALKSVFIFVVGKK